MYLFGVSFMLILLTKYIAWAATAKTSEANDADAVLTW